MIGIFPKSSAYFMKEKCHQGRKGWVVNSVNTALRYKPAVGATWEGGKGGAQGTVLGPTRAGTDLCSASLYLDLRNPTTTPTSLPGKFSHFYPKGLLS